MDEPTEFHESIPEDIPHAARVQFQRIVESFENTGYTISPAVPHFLPYYAKVQMTIDGIAFDESLPEKMPISQKLKHQKAINDFTESGNEIDPNLPSNFPRYLKVQIMGHHMGFHESIPEEMPFPEKVRFQKFISDFTKLNIPFHPMFGENYPYYTRCAMMMEVVKNSKEAETPVEHEAPLEPESPMEPVEQEAPEPQFQEAPAPKPKKELTPEEMQMQLLLDMQNMQMIG